MRKKIDYFFSLLDDNAIRYYLLRPIDFSDITRDIDFVLYKDDYSKLKEVLSESGMKLKNINPNANSSIQLLADELYWTLSLIFVFYQENHW